MAGALKKTAVLLVILFLGFWLVQDPNGFANSAQQMISTIWAMLEQLFASVISFFKSLTS